MNLVFHLLLLSLLQYWTSSYTACAPNRYGRRCNYQCKCKSSEDCNDGPKGNGDCTPRLNVSLLSSDATRKEQLRSSPFLANFQLLPTTFDQMTMDEHTGRKSRQIYGASGARILPAPFRNPALNVVALDHELAAFLGLEIPANLNDGHIRDLAEVFSGRKLLPGSITFAHGYAGHQFGQWAGQLGDGRATTLGDRLGLDGSHYEISLKGAGRTAFSRSGDGRAVLRNLVREFLSGAFLNAVGVPTSGALALVGSDQDMDGIIRDEYYTGSPEKLKPGVLSRVTPSFIRFGSIQLAAKRQGLDGVLKLARHALTIIDEQERNGDRSFFKYFAKNKNLLARVDEEIRENCFFAPRKQDTCAGSSRGGGGSKMLECFLDRLVARTAALVASWQAVGFAHGVSNTDNMSVFGVTIDMNVFGLITDYGTSHDFSPNFIDDDKRYKFGHQQKMAAWNLARVGDALMGKTRFVGGDRDSDSETNKKTTSAHDYFLTPEKVRQQIAEFNGRYQLCYEARLKWRIGLVGSSMVTSNAIAAWHDWMRAANVDYHKASRALGEFAKNSDDRDVGDAIIKASTTRSVPKLLSIELEKTVRALRSAVTKEYGHDDESWVAWQHHIRQATPYYVMRTHALQEIGQIVEGGNNAALQKALELLSNPMQLQLSGEKGDDYLNKHLKMILSSLPTEKEKGMKTSCGGQ